MGPVNSMSKLTHCLRNRLHTNPTLSLLGQYMKQPSLNVLSLSFGWSLAFVMIP